ncbi:MAG: aminotransferase class I/II-fold pyridoxal phosphate-dependent enzyme [Eubacterium sp.]
MELDDKLKNIDTYPFHMPGHKRNKSYNLIGSNIDITEIDGFDNLHNPKQVLKRMQEDIAELFGYKKSIISVNGSTCCILAAISAVCNKGDKIIIARNCHKSVYNACYINELEVEYIEPEYNSEYGFYGRVTQEAVDTAIKENPDAAAVVITSPTYEGITSNVHSTVPLIIDSAHGAHFGFAQWLPERANGDIVVQSLHKTLPCLTQTAVVHINNEKFYSKVKMYMDIFETSSPSYVLLDSVDRCIDFLKDSKSSFFEYKKRLDKFYDSARALKGIKIVKNDDITRIVISVNTADGIKLADILRKDFKLEVEGASLNYVILISTVADSDCGFDRLYKALKSLECKEADKHSILIDKPEIPKKALPSYKVNDTALTDLDKSESKICAEYVYSYPPGVPIIVPGEIINKKTINYIKKLFDYGVNIISESSMLPLKILTKN